LPSAEISTDGPRAPLLRVAGLTKRYRRVTALDDVAFDVHSGEVLGLIGPNGAGKTTLFECLAGMMPRDAGTVRIGGQILPPASAGAHLFYLPDAIAPWPAQPVGWALDFIIGFFGGRADQRDAVVAALNLDALLDRRIGTLSKGQRKRAMLAVGLLAPQPILLVDEPFDGLDLRQTRDVSAAIRAHAAGGRTVVLSIHQIVDAARVCDRFVLLSAGTVRGEGTLSELVDIASARGARSQDGLEEVFLALT
jgi:ABC-type multidrug transport system ATPase subunit